VLRVVPHRDRDEPWLGHEHDRKRKSPDERMTNSLWDALEEPWRLFEGRSADRFQTSLKSGREPVT
jgi:hypothetical protein